MLKQMIRLYDWNFTSDEDAISLEREAWDMAAERSPTGGATLVLSGPAGEKCVIAVEIVAGQPSVTFSAPPSRKVA